MELTRDETAMVVRDPFIYLRLVLLQLLTFCPTNATTTTTTDTGRPSQGGNHNYIVQSHLSGMALIHILVRHNQLALVRHVLEEQPETLHALEPNLFPTGSLTPLHVAAVYGHMEIIDCLLDHGAIINHPTVGGHGVTPLDFAVTMGNPRAVDLLLLRGADPTIVTSTTAMTPLMYAAMGMASWPEACGKLLCGRLLLDHSEGRTTINYQSSTGYTALHYAAASGVAKMVRMLLDARADPLLANEHGRTPLMEARDNPFRRDHREYIKLLEVSLT